MNDFEKEISAMNLVFDEGEGGTSTDAPGTDAPTTDAPLEDLTTDAPGTSAPSTDAPSTSAPTTEAPDTEALLRQEIEMLKAERDKKPTTTAPGTSAPTTDTPFTNEDFLGEADLDEITRDPEKFNELLNNVLKKGMEMAKGITSKGDETILSSLPNLVKNNLETITTLTKAKEEFYSNNEDLKPWGAVVATVFEEVAAKNPNNSLTDNLNLVGPEVRSRLNLKKGDTKPPKKNTPPSLPGNKGNKRTPTKPATEGIAAEIDAMNKSI